MPDSVLLVAGDVESLRGLGSMFERAGYEVARELDVETGLAAYDRLRPQVVLLELDLAGAGDLEAVARFRDRGAAVIVMGGATEAPAAVAAMQAGAENFLVAPVDPRHLQLAVARVAEKARLRHLIELFRRQAHPGQGLGSLGDSPAMRELVRQVGLAAAAERIPVLLLGEPGVGKRRLARIIHDMSPRARGPLLTVESGGREPGSLAEELLGSERPAAGGALERRPGLVESASGGTLSFSEIEALPAEVQPLLLRLLEARTFRRVGGTRDLAADVRVIAASSRPLSGLLDGSCVREDLAYRLNAMPITLPAVRERAREDRVALLRSVVAEARGGSTMSESVISPEALERLVGYPWPGNVSEMQQVVSRALLLAGGREPVGLDHLPGEFRNRPGTGDRRHTPMTLDALE
ncbi:MAG: sigma 54-interacting transcriptional regulator, partial [Gemmatimonadota bacterium]|nr:sigma 54-interacting transcriptional regulator [Gemmatimonadota bacterium]